MGFFLCYLSWSRATRDLKGLFFVGRKQSEDTSFLKSGCPAKSGIFFVQDDIFGIFWTAVLFNPKSNPAPRGTKIQNLRPCRAVSPPFPQLLLEHDFA
jgi:hypothetical protein